MYNFAGQNRRRTNMTKRIISGVLALASAFALCACGAQKEKAQEEITLKWILSGAGKQADSDEVWSEFNKKLGEYMPGVHVEFEAISINDYAEKWKIMSAAGEEADIAWEGWVNDLEQEIGKGSFMPIDSLMAKYAPGLYESMPEWVWNGVTYDGKIYAVPNYQMMVNRPVAIRTPKALADQYMDKEKMERVFKNYRENCEKGRIPEECFDALGEYMQNLKDAGKLGLGLTPEISGWLNGGTVEGVYVSKKDGRVVAQNRFDFPETEIKYKKLAEFYQKGFIRANALSVQDFKTDIGADGGYTLWVHNYDDYTEAEEELYYGFPVELIRVSEGNTIPWIVNATNTVIPSTSKHPDKAMELIGLINSEKGKELYNLLVYGIEGKHYVKTGEDSVRTLDYNGTPGVESKYGVAPHFIGNTFNAYASQVSVPGYNEYIENVLHKNARYSMLYGFKFSSKDIRGELAQIESINDEYVGLEYGVYPDYKQKLNEMKEKLKKAGIDKVIGELQRQLDEQINNKQGGQNQ